MNRVQRKEAESKLTLQDYHNANAFNEPEKIMMGYILRTMQALSRIPLKETDIEEAKACFPEVSRLREKGEIERKQLAERTLESKLVN